MIKVTEQDSHYNNLELKTTEELLEIINNEDNTVPNAVRLCIPDIEKLVNVIVEKLENGGRLFYIGSGTSGRLGIVDASECPPTFGVPEDLVIGLIAGGDSAIRTAVEGAEDNTEGGWNDLLKYHVSEKDVVIGLAASGTTPYVVGALKRCRENGIVTGCITCNIGSPVELNSDYPIVAVVGPEVVTGSTRMKSGTAQKLILNMISTATMIRLGRVKGNKMVDMQLSNEKLVQRGTRMIRETYNLPEGEARELLLKYGSVRRVFKKLGTDL